MYARFFIENKETIGLILIIFYAMLLVLAILDLVLSKIKEHKQIKEQIRQDHIKTNEYRKAIVSKQVKAIMNCDL